MSKDYKHKESKAAADKIFNDKNTKFVLNVMLNLMRIDSVATPMKSQMQTMTDLMEKLDLIDRIDDAKSYAEEMDKLDKATKKLNDELEAKIPAIKATFFFKEEIEAKKIS